MASDDINKKLSQSDDLLKNNSRELKRMESVIRKIGNSLENAIQNALDGANALDDAGKALENTYARDVSNAMMKSARQLEGMVDTQLKLMKGENISKKINDALLKNKAKMKAAADHMKVLKEKGVKTDWKQYAALQKSLEIEKAILEKQKEESKLLVNQQSIFSAIGDAMGDVADKYDKSGTLSGILKGNMDEVLTAQNLIAVGNAAFVSTLFQGIMYFDKIQTQYAKSFGMTDEATMLLQKRFGNIQKSSSDTGITLFKLNKTMAMLSDEAGFLATAISDEAVEGATNLWYRMGLSNKGMAQLTMTANTLGKTIEEQNLEMIRGTQEISKQFGQQVDINKAYKTASELTGMIRANLGRQYGEVIKTVAAAQMLNLTMQDLAMAGSNLLDFQSSIEKELTAELFIGKELNLEKARLYALTGDYANLQKEIVKNIGSEAEFLGMNVMAREKYAQALGFTGDQLANLIFQQTDLAELERQAIANNDEVLLKQVQQRNLQMEMSDLMENVQTSFLNIAGGPLGDIVSFMSKMAESSFMVYTALGLIAAVQLGALANGIAMLAVRMKILGVSAGVARGLMMGLAGLAMIGIAAGLYTALTSKANEADSKVTKTTRHKNLGAGKAIVIQEGPHNVAVADGGESIVNTKDLESIVGGNNEKMDMMVNALESIDKKTRLTQFWEQSKQYS